MTVHVNALLPVRPITVADLDRMVEAGIVAEDDRVELLEGVLVEMSPQSEEHAYAIRQLMALAAPAASAAGLSLSVQAPLEVGNPISRPEPDLAIVPPTPRDRHPSDSVLVVEIGVSSRAVDLGPKASVYAAAGVPDYWVLDIDARELVVHREPSEGRFGHVLRLGEGEIATAVAIELSVPVGALL